MKRWFIYLARGGIILAFMWTAMSYLKAECNKEPETTEKRLSLGPLTINPINPRYFADGTGKAIYLTGSHTWNNFQGMGWIFPIPFSYSGYLNFLKNNNHNFFRLWVWEQAAWLSTVPGKILFRPSPYMRTGPGKALDGKPKFDLTKYNEVFFKGLRSKVIAAGSKGIYVSVMLFNGFSIDMKGTQGGNPWRAHPFNAENNINGVNGDPQGNGDGGDTHTMKIPEITALQENYVRKMIDTISDLDNVLWEISNESNTNSTEWQYHMTDFIHSYEMGKGKVHPVLMTSQYSGVNATLFASSAEAVSPNYLDGYRDDPPVADGSKVIINDTDHLWGTGGNHVWVWKSFLRGLNPVFMDPYHVPTGYWGGLTSRQLNLIRRNMGYALRLANQMDLAGMLPQPQLASSGYCLAQQGREYTVYAQDGQVWADLSGATGGFTVEWLNPLTGSWRKGDTVQAGTLHLFSSPFGGGDAILHLKAK